MKSRSKKMVEVIKVIEAIKAIKWSLPRQAPL